MAVCLFGEMQNLKPPAGIHSLTFMLTGNVFWARYNIPFIIQARLMEVTDVLTGGNKSKRMGAGCRKEF